MANKPMPSLRNGPSPAAASSFVDGGSVVLHIAEVHDSSEPTVTSEGALVAEVTRAPSKSPRRPAADKRRMTIYLSKGNAKKLALRSVHDERDMSEIVEEALTAFFEKAK